MKHYLYSTLIFLLIEITVYSKNTNSNNKHLNIEYKIAETGIFVTIPLKDTANTLTIKFPIVMPGTYDSIKTAFKIYNFTINNSKAAYKTDSLKRCINIYDIANNKITYFVKTGIFSTPNILNDNIFVNPDLVVLNNHILTGIISGYEKSRIKLTVIKNEKYKNISSSVYTIIDDKTDVYTYNSFKEMYDNPIIYSSKAKKFQINSNGISFNFGIYAPLNKISTKTLSIILKPTIDAITKEYSFCYNKNNYNLTLIFNPSVAKDINYMTALEHKKSSVYCFFSEPNLKNINDSLKFAKDLKCYVSHECTHLFIPLYFSDSLTTNFNYFKAENGPNLLLYEGFTEYQSLKLLLKNKIISNSTFLREIEKKIVKFDMYRKMGYFFNLNKLSRDIYKKPNWLKIFYSRGAVLSFLLDINIIKHTNGKEDLFSILKEISKKHNPFNDTQAYYEILKKIPTLKNFFDSYIFGDKYPDIKTELLKCGLSYSKIIPNSKYFYPFRIVNSYNKKPQVYFYKKNYIIPKDTFYLEAINNTSKINSFIVGKIYQHYVPNENNNFKLKKNGITKNYIVKPLKSDYPPYPFYPHISIINNMNNSQKLVSGFLGITPF